MDKQEPKLTLEEAVEVSNTFARGASRTILEALERQGVSNQYLRKIVLDAVNNLKRNIVREVYKAE